MADQQGTEAAARRSPVQERSQRRVRSILAAAAELLADVGYEHVTTSAIAARAGISVGSLYQFFANKEAVMQGLAELYLEELRTRANALFPPDAVYAPLEVLVARLVDMLVGSAMRHRGFYRVIESGLVSTELQMLAETMGEELTRRIAAILAYKAPNLSEAQRWSAAFTTMHIVRGVLAALDAAQAEAHAALIVEFKRAGVSYLQDVVQRSAAAQPEQLARAY
jgi:AcrR family transcriptional regulator